MKKFVLIFFLYICLAQVADAQTESKNMLLLNASGNTVTLGAPGAVTNNTILFPGTLGLLGAIPYISSVAGTVGTTTWLNPGTNGFVLTLAGGIPSWSNLASVDWQLVGNSIAAAYNGTTGSFLGTTNTQPFVIATTNTGTAQPIEFYTNNIEKMRLAATGELGIGLTPTAGKLLHVTGTSGTSNVRLASLASATGTSGRVMFATDATGDLQTLAFPGTSGYVLSSTTAGVLSWITPTTLSWSLTGNGGTTPGVAAGQNYLGTSDAKNLIFATAATERMRILSTGNVSINSATAPQAFTIGGDIGIVGVGSKVTSSGTANELIMEETTDTYGTSRLRMQDRNGSNGALFEQVENVGNPGVDLVDFGFKPGTKVQSNIRLEARTTVLRGTPNITSATAEEFQFLFGSTTTPQYVLSIGQGATLLESGNFGIGYSAGSGTFPVASPLELLDVHTGNIILSNTGTSGATGTAGILKFQGTRDGISSFAAGAQASNTFNYTLPTSVPSAGQVLSINTISGATPYAVALNWTTATTGTVTGSGTATQLAFWSGTVGNASTALSSSSNLFWDNTNSRLGIGTGTTPTSPLHVASALTASSGNATGVLINQTLSAAANNDVLYGVNITPTFTNGAFTGLTNYSLRSVNAGTLASSAAIRAEATGNGGASTEVIGVWGIATNATQGSNTNAGVGVRAEGNNTTTDANSNIGLQIVNGAFIVARQASSAANDNTVANNILVSGEDDANGLADQGPSGIVDVTDGGLPGVNSSTTGSLVVFNRYAKAHSIILVTPLDGGTGTLGTGEINTYTVSARAAGSFTINVIRSKPGGVQGAAGTWRVAFLIVNPSK